MIEVGKVAMIKVSDVKIEDRTREEFGDLKAFAENLKERGLISPIAVQETLSKTEGPKYMLLAGERRFTVIRQVNGDDAMIPARIYTTELSDLEMKEIEMSENFYRKDMEWYEYDKLTADIHKLKQKIHGIADPGSSKSEGWRGQDTGDLLGITKASVSSALKRNKAMEQFPDLFNNCKTASDASKVLKKLDESFTKQIIVEKLEAQKSNTTLTELSKRYMVKDFFVGIKDVPDNYFHLVEIDPPYAIDLMDTKRADTQSQYNPEDYNEISSDKYLPFLDSLLSDVYRTMAEHSWLVVWFAPEPWFELVYKSIRSAGFSCSRMCGIWTKPTGQSLQPQTKLANAYEMFFYASKGDPALNKPGRINIYNTPPVQATKKVHPTERPIELMEEIYDTFCFTSSRVLIPFLGSGNGIIAAHNKGMDAIGFEKSKGYRDSFLIKVNELKTR